MKYSVNAILEGLRDIRIGESADWSGYKVRYTYQGDSLSDYESTCIVKAKDEKSAVKTAMQKINREAARNFRIDGKIESYKEYKKQFPHSNLDVFESSDMKSHDLRRVCEASILDDLSIYRVLEGAYSNFKVPKRDIQKMQEYYQKGSNPKTLANTVKDTNKAVSRYYISVSTGWKECEETFYNRCIDLGVYKEDLEEVKKQAEKDKSISLGDAPSNKDTKTVTKSKQTAPKDDFDDKPKGWIPF